MLRATVDEMPVARLVSPWLGVSITMLPGGCQPAGEARRYQLHGQLLTIRPATKQVLIKHGDIRNFMPGMTMPFKVRDERMLSDKAPGDLVTAQLMVGANEARLATLEKTGTAPLDEPAAIPPSSLLGPLQPGNEVLDTSLMNQDGQAVSLGTITHNLRTAVIDPQGRVVRVQDGNQWTSAQVLDDLERSDTR